MTTQAQHLCLTWSDILYQLHSLSTHGEAEAQLVLLHNHTSVHKSSAWGEEEEEEAVMSGGMTLNETRI